MSTTDKFPDMEEPAVCNSALEWATLSLIEKIPEPKQQEMCSKVVLAQPHTNPEAESETDTPGLQ